MNLYLTTSKNINLSSSSLAEKEVHLLWTVNSFSCSKVTPISMRMIIYMSCMGCKKLAYTSRQLGTQGYIYQPCMQLMNDGNIQHNKYDGSFVLMPKSVMQVNSKNVQLMGVVMNLQLQGTNIKFFLEGNFVKASKFVIILLSKLFLVVHT